MIVRFFASLAAGLLVGNILSEAARAGLNVLMPDRIDPTLLLGPVHPDSLTLLFLIGIWLLMAASSSALASAISGTALAGWLCATAWALALALAAGLSGAPDALLGVALTMVVLGTLLGNHLAATAAGPVRT
jgi:hypothetical protein